MKLPTPKDLNLNNQKVFIRLDLDVSARDHEVLADNRLEFSLETIKYCIDHAGKVLLAGHRGRPGGKYQSQESTHSLIKYLSRKLNKPVIPIEFKPFLQDFHQLYDFYNNHPDGLFLLENLRFWTGEEENSDNFSQALSGFVDIYFNEAFATSHRKHASVYGLPLLLKQQKKPVSFGFHFAQEINKLSEVLNSNNHPKVILISGAKQDKLEHLSGLKQNFDKILLGGKLPLFLPEDFANPKVIVARLVQDKLDITINSMESFASALKPAKVIVFSGPLGFFEQEGHSQGTTQVLTAIQNNKDSFKVAGGGDTEAALKKLGFVQAFDWISTGGGAMLEFLSSENGTLPAIEVLNQ